MFYKPSQPKTCMGPIPFYSLDEKGRIRIRTAFWCCELPLPLEPTEHADHWATEKPDKIQTDNHKQNDILHMYNHLLVGLLLFDCTWYYT